MASKPTKTTVLAVGDSVTVKVPKKWKKTTSRLAGIVVAVRGSEQPLYTVR